MDVANAVARYYEDEVLRTGNALIEDEPTKEAIRAVGRWLTSENARVGLLMYGGIGNGKSTLLKAVARFCKEFLPHEGYDDTHFAYRFQRINAERLASIAKRDDHLWEEYKDCMFLAVDDLGTEPTTVNNYGTPISPMVELIQQRYDKRRFTVITSNLDDENIAKRYGARVADRFEEMFDRIYFSRSSYRVRKTL